MTPTPARRALSGVAALWLLSCASSSAPPADSTDSEPHPARVVAELEQDAARSRAADAVPDSVRAELLPDFEPEPLARHRDGGTRFDLAVSNVPTREFFLGLVQDSDENIVVHPGVSGEISLALRGVTIEEVLGAVHDVYGYEYERSSYGWHVRPAGLQTRTFQVDYLNVHRKGRSQTRVSSGQVSERTPGTVSSGGSSGGGAANARSNAGGTPTGVSGSQIATTTDADFWTELREALHAILGEGDGRSVVLSPNTGVLVVRALPEELRQVGRFLERIQSNLNRQVVLEAKILEVTLSDGFRSGINWAQLVDLRGSGNALGAQTGGGNSIGSDGLSAISGEDFDLDPRTPDLLSSALAEAFGGVFSLAIQTDNFTAFIELLETQGSVHTLSSPRVSTVNNQKAVIKVGTDEFFVTGVSSTTVAGTVTTTTPEVELTPFFSGIALDVTPQINDRGEIILHIHPSISEVSDQTKVVTVQGEEQRLPLALSTIRESDSIVRAQSGQVIVIGGLMQDTQANSRAATPWLSHIPYLGGLFRHQLDAEARTELVILMRPLAVGAGTWTRVIEDSLSRVRDLEESSGR